MKLSEIFPDMTKLIPESKRLPGYFYIEHMVVDEHASRMTSLRGGMGHVPPGTYCGLKRAQKEGNSSWDTLWMSDTPFERTTNYNIIKSATGNVLIIGLGLGMVPAALCRKSEVSSIMVLEIEPEVVRLIARHIRHPKLQVIIADGNVPPLKGKHFDTIYIDIWSDICSDYWKEMKSLLAMYRRYRRNGAIVTAWLKNYIQQEYAKANREI